MSVFFEIFILSFLALGLYAEASRGLFLALTDVVRVVVGFAAGLGGYAIGKGLLHSYLLGFIGFGVFAPAAVMAIPALLRFTKLDPPWGKTVAGRSAGGVIGLAIGAAICVAFVPVLAHTPFGRQGARRSLLARPFLETAPWLYTAADRLNIDLPMLNVRPIRFEDEGKAAEAALVDRINYSKLAGSTCIECGAAVGFAGYRRKFEVAVSPKLVCPGCGRTSDGCQTFEGFHTMYDRCVVSVAAALGPIDCGVWPNNRPALPNGACPVCGRALEP
jgi:hypothetical protein